MVWLLCALYMVSQIDRTILAVVAVPISLEMKLTDTQLGLLGGAGFAIIYSLVGVPIANYIDNDRSNRVRVITAGVLIWSISTILCAFTSSVWELAACRLGVAVGEAALTPAAISLFSDLFDEDRQTLPVSLYSGIATLLVAGSLAIGGGAFHLGTSIASLFDLSPWRTTMVVVGIPGLLVVGLFCMVAREPARRGAARSGSQATIIGGLIDLVRHLRANWRFFVPLYVGLAAWVTYMAGATLWLPTILSRAYGISPSANGALLASAVLPASFIATIFWPWLAHRLQTRRHDGLILCYLIAVVIAGPFMIFAPLAGSAALFAAGMGIAFFGILVGGALPSLTIQTYGAYRFRARLIAVMFLCGHLIGSCLGPLLVPQFASLWDGDPMALNYSLSVLGVITMGVIIISFLICQRQIARFGLAAHQNEAAL